MRERQIQRAWYDREREGRRKEGHGQADRQTDRVAEGQRRKESRRGERRLEEEGALAQEDEKTEKTTPAPCAIARQRTRAVARTITSLMMVLSCSCSEGRAFALVVSVLPWLSISGVGSSVSSSSARSLCNPHRCHCDSHARREGQVMVREGEVAGVVDDPRRRCMSARTIGTVFVSSTGVSIM